MPLEVNPGGAHITGIELSYKKRKEHTFRLEWNGTGRIRFDRRYLLRQCMVYVEASESEDLQISIYRGKRKKLQGADRKTFQGRKRTRTTRVAYSSEDEEGKMSEGDSEGDSEGSDEDLDNSD